jgi:hypothetical protein
LGRSRGCPLPYPLVSRLCYWAITYVKGEAGCLLSFFVGCQPTAAMTDCRELLPRANSKDLVPPTWAVPPGAGGGLSHFLEDRVVYFYIHFFMIFQKYRSHFKFCKFVPPPPYYMTFGSNRHMVRRLEVLQCSGRRITQWL